MDIETKKKIEAEMQRRGAPMAERSNEAGTYVGAAREKVQEAGELLQRAARALHGRCGEQECQALSLTLFDIAEGESAEPEQGFRNLHRYLGEQFREDMEAMQRKVVEEFGEFGEKPKLSVVEGGKSDGEAS